MFSSQIFTNLNLLSSSSSTQSISSSRNTAFLLTNPRCSLRCQVEIPLETQELQSRTKESETTWRNKEDDEQTRNKDSMERGKGDRDAKEISGIRVPRQRYISVSKADLLSATLSMFETQEEAEEFRRVSTCLDSILHAEHKGILEEMRIDYSLTQSLDSKSRGGDVENLENLKEETLVNGKHKLEESADAFKSNQANAEEEKVNDFGLMSFSQGLDWSFLLGLSGKKDLSKSASLESRIAVATRFQRSFMKLLRNAQFEELSARDLLLTSSLNTDYLLTLPINVDWKRASESNAIIFRRGYATETQRGFLFVEKLDYLQSRLLQGVFFSLSKPLGKIGMWIKEALESASQNQEFEVWIKRTKLWLKEPFSQPLYSNNESIFDSQTITDQLSDSDLPIWLAAQRAVPRYEGLLSSIGPRGRLLRRLLIWTGLVPSTPETSPELDCENTSSELYLRPTFLSRVSLGDIWRPATKERCGNDLLKMFQTAISILFSQSILQEPAFQELILLYTEEMVHGENEDKAEVPPLKLKIYEKIPIPDLPVVFPHKKLSFRIIDTVRLDAASILGLLAFFVNYKFEDIRSSLSAILLDVIAISALIIYVTRIALGYKQTWDRYQLLVNRTLYEKTLASGFGSVHFLLDASEQQQFKEAILAYAILLQAADQMTSHKSIGDSCEKFMYNKFQKKVEMPVDKALNTLLRFGLVREVSHDGNIRFQALSCSEAYKFLKQHWECLLT